MPAVVSNSTSRMLAVAAVAALPIVVIDQMIKATVRADMSLGERISLMPGLELVYTRNSGIAFGFLSGKAAIFITVGLAALIGLAVYLALRSSSTLSWVSFGLLVGGATSNIADRISSGAVTDYIDPSLWPAFNLADAAIVVGVFGLLADVLQPEDPDGGRLAGD